MYSKTGSFLLGILLAACCSSVMAQDANVQRAQQVYDFMVAGQGDSLYVYSSEEVREKVIPEVLGDTFKGVEKQYGKYVSAGDWQQVTAEGATLYFRDLVFEKGELRFQTMFNDEGKAKLLWFAPVPPKQTATPVLLDNKTVKEKEIEVCDGDFKLPGILTYPTKVKKFPVLILVHGSGPQDRDETVGPNKPFRDLAWGLAKQGVAVIRYDKRTLVYGAHSSLQGKDFTLNEETVNDALAAIRLAKAIPGADPERIYVLGHSQGGMMAPLIAERTDKDLAGIILLAAPARKFEKMLEDQHVYLTSLRDDKPDTKTFVDSFMQRLPEGYRNMLNEYNQVNTARKLSLPILVLQGERDYQVTMEDYGLWRFGLFRNANVQFKSYPALNHLLQEGSGKSTPYEYQYAAPVPAYVMDDIVRFINRLEIKN